MSTSTPAPTHAPTAAPSPAPAPAARPAVVRGTVLALVLGLVASLFAAPQAASAGTASHARTAWEFKVAIAVVHLINAERRAHHLRPVAGSAQLNTAARRHNITMSGYNSMSHQLPGEAYFSKRISATGFRWSTAGENIAWNSQMSTKGILVLQTAMYNEKAPNDGHRLNILDPSFTYVGADVYLDRAHHKIWLTTDFARRR